MGFFTDTDPAIERAREAALRMLDRSRKTRRDLERRLAAKGFPGPVAAAALDRLARVGLVDDVEYARAYARSKLARRAVALRVIEQQLAARGISRPDRAAALTGLAEAAAAAPDDPTAALGRPGGAGERERADRALAPLLKRYRSLTPAEAGAKAQAALLRRGFDYQTAREAVRQALDRRSPEEEDLG